MLRIPFEPYDKVLLGVPWVRYVAWWSAVIVGDLRPPNSSVMIGQWRGTAKTGGIYTIRTLLAPGVVLRWGQRNRATGRTMNEGYGITTSHSAFKQVDRMTAWQWYVATNKER